MQKNTFLPKYQVVLQTLKQEILEGKYSNGRIPSEVQLAARFGISRPTVSKALRDLANENYVERRVGSGTYPKTGRVKGRIGLILPDFKTAEIFAVISGAVNHHAAEAGYSVLFGNTTIGSIEKQGDEVLELCRRYIREKVAGILIEPVEIFPGYEKINREIVKLFQSSGIPVVLLDREILPFPQHSGYDLVGIDNVAAGARLAHHLFDQKCRRILFAVRPGSAPTVRQRIAGIAEASCARGFAFSSEHIFCGNPESLDFARQLLDAAPDAVICANDTTAAQLLQQFTIFGTHIPRNLKIAAFDDVNFARLLLPGLTTIHQPCEDLGRLAVETLLSRIKSPESPPRNVLLNAPLIIRDSTRTD